MDAKLKSIKAQISAELVRQMELTSEISIRTQIISHVEEVNKSYRAVEEKYANVEKIVSHNNIVRDHLKCAADRLEYLADNQVAESRTVGERLANLNKAYATKLDSFRNTAIASKTSCLRPELKGSSEELMDRLIALFKDKVKRAEERALAKRAHLVEANAELERKLAEGEELRAQLAEHEVEHKQKSEEVRLDREKMFVLSEQLTEYENIIAENEQYMEESAVVLAKDEELRRELTLRVAQKQEQLIQVVEETAVIDTEICRLAEDIATAQSELLNLDDQENQMEDVEMTPELQQIENEIKAQSKELKKLQMKADVLTEDIEAPYREMTTQQVQELLAEKDMALTAESAELSAAVKQLEQEVEVEFSEKSMELVAKLADEEMNLMKSLSAIEDAQDKAIAESQHLAIEDSQIQELAATLESEKKAASQLRSQLVAVRGQMEQMRAAVASFRHQKTPLKPARMLSGKDVDSGDISDDGDPSSGIPVVAGIEPFSPATLETKKNSARLPACSQEASRNLFGTKAGNVTSSAAFEEESSMDTTLESDIGSLFGEIPAAYGGAQQENAMGEDEDLRSSATSDSLDTTLVGDEEDRFPNDIFLAGSSASASLARMPASSPVSAQVTTASNSRDAMNGFAPPPADADADLDDSINISMLSEQSAW